VPATRAAAAPSSRYEHHRHACDSQSERFLNDLKAVFKVHGCYFLAAVSEDAAATFDRRTLDVRTTFDDAFDTIVKIPPSAVAAGTQPAVIAE
jgi:hypothetical protein